MCTTVIPLRTCLLSEITRFDSLASVLLLARDYVPFPKNFMFSLSNFYHLARSVAIAHTHKQTGRDFYVHMCTNIHVYTVTSLIGNLSICRSTSFLFQEHEFWEALKFLHAHVHKHARVHSNIAEKKPVHMLKYKLSFSGT